MAQKFFWYIFASLFYHLYFLVLFKNKYWIWICAQQLPNSNKVFFFDRLLHFFYIVLIIAHTKFLYSFKLILDAIAKIYFVIKPNFVLIFWEIIFFKPNYSPIYTIFCNFFIHLLFSTRNAFMIVYYVFFFILYILNILNLF